MTRQRRSRRLPGASRWAAPLALCLGVAACGISSQDSAPSTSVLVVVVDALRPDHLGSYGYGRATSPVIDALAAESLVFETALSPASWTKPAIASLLTGLYPGQHGVVTGNKADGPVRITSDLLSDRHPTLAEAFQAGGYATAAFIHNTHLSSFLGFDQGFDLYAEELGDADAVTAAFLEWIDGDPARPFFAYVHYIDPHWPYTPPAEFDRFSPARATGGVDFNNLSWKSFQRQIQDGELELSAADLTVMRSLYDGEIRFTDDAFGRLLAGLEASGRSDDTVIILTADHGEEFLEHGGVGHGETLYEEVVRIPLLVRAPGLEPRRESEPASLVDILPTAIDLAGLPPTGEVAGRSLRSPSGRRPLFADHRPGGDRGRWLQSVREDRYKLIRTFRLAAVDEGAKARRRLVDELEPGRWVEVEGLPRGERLLQATEVELIEPRGELRISAPIEGLATGGDRFRLLGLECRLDPMPRLETSDGRPFNPLSLEEGAWVKVRGELEAETTLRVERIVLIDDPEEREIEIKAPIAKLHTGEDGLEVLTLAGIAATIDNETEFEGPWGAPGPAGGGAVPAETPAAPRLAELRERRELTAVELYDLARDPGEAENLAPRRPELVARLMGLLDGWERQQESAYPVEQAPLDDATIERLRALGYVN